MFNQDKLFSKPINNLNNWIFDSSVVEVFPDMIQRSIPGYSTIIYIIGILAKSFVKPNTLVYDLGCSLGAATISILRNVNHINYKIIAIDNSSAMIECFSKNIKKHKKLSLVEIIEGDIRNLEINNASMVILNFTLQFLALDDRQKLLNKIFKGLNSGGILILSEKFFFKDKIINKILFNMHYDFKRANGYSNLEINQKNILLKKTMLIDSIKIHKARLQKAGFNHIELWFQYLNFGSLIALKNNFL